MSSSKPDIGITIGVLNNGTAKIIAIIVIKVSTVVCFDNALMYLQDAD